MAQRTRKELNNVGDLYRYLKNLIKEKAQGEGNAVFVKGEYITSDFDYDNNILKFAVRYSINRVKDNKVEQGYEDEVYEVRFREGYSQVEFGKFGELLRSIKIKGNEGKGYFSYGLEEGYYSLLAELYILFYTTPKDSEQRMTKLFRKMMVMEGNKVGNKSFVCDLNENTTAELFTLEYDKGKEKSRAIFRMYTKDGRVFEKATDRVEVKLVEGGFRRLPNGVRSIRHTIEGRKMYGKYLLTGLDVDGREYSELSTYFIKIEQEGDKQTLGDVEEYRKK